MHRDLKTLKNAPFAKPGFFGKGRFFLKIKKLDNGSSREKLPTESRHEAPEGISCDSFYAYF